MHASDTVQRVRIYLSEGDDIGGRPRYLATLELLREAGATGATALRGIAGFGVSQRLLIAQGDTSRAMPIVIEWVDRAERVARILPTLDSLLPDALITVEAVQIYRATLRTSGPFGERSVGELASRDVATITNQRSMAEAVRLLIDAPHPVLPVLDDSGRLVGSVGAGDLRRHKLPAPQELVRMPETEREPLLAGVSNLALANAMTTEVLALTAESSMLQAAKAMIEWGLDEVPVISRDGTFYGLFGIDQALQAAQEARAPSEGPIRNADAPTPIGMLMQGVRQTVLGYALAVEGIERLQATGGALLVVVDNGRPLGLLDREALLVGLDASLREKFLALSAGGAPSSAALQELFGETRVASLPLIALPTLPTSAPYDQAIALLREQRVPWLAAVDDAGKLQGLVGRRTLLRALVQESGA